MHEFSGAILGSEHDPTLPTVAHIEGKCLILSSPEGLVEEWPLDRVQVIEVGNGYFQMVSDDRTLSLVVDEPEAFGEALDAEGADRTPPSQVKLDLPKKPRVRRHGKARHHAPSTGRFRGLVSLSSRPRHGRASVRPLPFTVAVAAVVTLSYLAGSFVGGLLNAVTTQSPHVAQTPAAEVVVRKFQGSEDGTTSPFAVQARWEVRWSFEAPEGARLEVLLLTEDGGRNAVAVQEGPGSGAVPLWEAGVFRLETRSTDGAEWTVRVVQLANAGSG